MAATRSDLKTAATIFYVAGVVLVAYGLGFLLSPHVMLNLSQDPGVPTNGGWVRWAGGPLLGMGVAAWLAANNPEKQGPLIVGFAVAFTLIALALLYSTLGGEYLGVQWFIWLPIVITAVSAAAMWWLAARYTRP